MVASGDPRLVLCQRLSGIGKSSVVNELHKVLVPPRGLFASGKFDQLKRDIPYATLAQAFQSLIRQLLGKPEAELSTWRGQLRQALDPNGALVIDLIPELKFVIGEQPPVPEVPPAPRRHDSSRRSADSSVCSRAPSIRWRCSSMICSGSMRRRSTCWRACWSSPSCNICFSSARIGTTRSIAAHPLTRKLSAIRESGAIVRDVVLGPLDHDDLTQWFADALHGEPERVGPLAKLVHEKTAGNPFFANQFLQELVAGDLITFDARSCQLALGPRAHPRQGLHGQCRGSHGRQVEPAPTRHAARP